MSPLEPRTGGADEYVPGPIEMPILATKDESLPRRVTQERRQDGHRLRPAGTRQHGRRARGFLMHVLSDGLLQLFEVERFAHERVGTGPARHMHPD